MNNDDELDDEIDREWISSADEQKVRALQCACCRLIRHKLPPIAQDAIQLGEDYNKGLVGPEILEVHANALWRYEIDGEKKLDADARNDLINSVRAALGCVFVGPIDRQEASDHYVWGTMFCNRLADHRTEQSTLHDEFFGVGFKYE